MKFQLRLLITLALLLTFLPAWAQDVGEVMVAGQVLMRIHSDAQERADAITRRIEEGLDKNWPIKTIQAEKSPEGYVVVWNGQVICLVDEFQARRNNSEVRTLAIAWAQKLYDFASKPLFRVTPALVTMPRGQSQLLTVKGLLKGPIAAQFDTNLLEVVIDESNDQITLTSRGVGYCELVLTRDNRTARVKVFIKDWAGELPDEASGIVTGRPAGADVLYQAAYQAAREAVVLRPGASYSFPEPAQVPDGIPAGMAGLAMVPIQIQGEGYFTLTRSLRVVLNNQELPYHPCRALLVSNRPELVLENGILFSAPIPGSQAIRLLYSHKNGTTSGRWLRVLLKNRQDQPAVVQVLGGRAGPDRNEIFVGHMAARRFLDALNREEGYLATLHPGETLSVAEIYYARDEVISGLAQFQVNQGPQLELVVESRDSWEGLLPRLAAPFNPFRIHPRGTFTPAEILLSASYRAGDEPVEIEFGQGPWLVDTTTGEPNTGNFGALYRMQIELENPSPATRQVEMAFNPLGEGAARGTFLLDGQLLDTTMVRPGGQVVLTSLTLGPGERRTLNMVTLPEAGSSYPARLILRPPTPILPPIEPPGATPSSPDTPVDQNNGIYW